MQDWNLLHAARWKYRTQKRQKNRHLGTIAQLCRAISSQLKHISIIGKNVLSSNHNMVHFSPLAAEIGPVLWGTPPNCNGFRVLVALLHGIRCYVEQRAPPIFGRATITLGNGPHSSLLGIFDCVLLANITYTGILLLRPSVLNKTLRIFDITVCSFRRFQNWLC